MRSSWGAIIDAPSECPHDSDFEHDNYYGCVPKTFSPATGEAKGHHQTRSVLPVRGWGKELHQKGTTGRFVWDGGCDQVELAAFLAGGQTDGA